MNGPSVLSRATRQHFANFRLPNRSRVNVLLVVTSTVASLIGIVIRGPENVGVPNVYPSGASETARSPYNPSPSGSADRLERNRQTSIRRRCAQVAVVGNRERPVYPSGPPVNAFDNFNEPRHA